MSDANLLMSHVWRGTDCEFFGRHTFVVLQKIDAFLLELDLIKAKGE